MVTNSTPEQIVRPAEMVDIKEKLLAMCMKDKWDKVVKLCKENLSASVLKITMSGDTALHIAVSAGKEEIVYELVKFISNEQDYKKALEIGNERGNTPLHVAASTGNVAMCECIAKVNPSVEENISKEQDYKKALEICALAIGNERGNTPLHVAASTGNVAMCECIAKFNPSVLMGARNADGETPFFLAVLNGKKEAFLSLQNLCSQENGILDHGYAYSRWRKDGDNILHCAIRRDYFDLAFQIIHIYPDLVNFVNTKGFYPLHELASKPYVFKSGSHLGLLERIIYHCTVVDELKVQSPHRTQQPGMAPLKTTSSTGIYENLPENYSTCINLFQLVFKYVCLVFTILWRGPRSAPTGQDQYEGDRRDAENPGGGQGSQDSTTGETWAKRVFPTNYGTGYELILFASKAMMIILGLGSNRIKEVRDKKQKHSWALQVMEQLLPSSTQTYIYADTAGMVPNIPKQPNDDETKPYEFDNEVGSVKYVVCPVETTGGKGQDNNVDEEKNMKGMDKTPQKSKRPDTPILFAAKYGITEIVDKILKLFPIAINDTDKDKKNIVLLAVENRHPDVYKFFLKHKNFARESAFREVDKDGNSALHLAAKHGDYKPWRIPGAALQMQWEIKWHKFVEDSMPPDFFPQYNNNGQTPSDIFTESHKDLFKSGGKWLIKTSESCSVVAALISTVAFATSATIPGGFKQDSGIPSLENNYIFAIFSNASLIALGFSVMAVVMFLAILTSRYEEGDFGKGLPKKLLIGLTSLFIAIALMLISFCAGHFFILQEDIKYLAFPVYVVTCLPVTFFALSQFPLYLDLVKANFTRVPQRNSRWFSNVGG